jgi:hypothetical protein
MCTTFAASFVFQRNSTNMADSHSQDDANRNAREAAIRLEIEARRRAVEEARLNRLADEFRLESDSVPAVSGNSPHIGSQPSRSYLRISMLFITLFINAFVSVPDNTEAHSAPKAMRYDEILRFGVPICDKVEQIDDLLPNLAGKLEIGIAANVDSAISKDKVLRVVMATTRTAAAIYSAAATLGAYQTECPRSSEEEKLLVGLAFASVFYDIVGTVRAPGRSAWRTAGEYIVVDPKEATQALRNRVREVLNLDKDLPAKCLMVLNSTKISWWQTNHHVGAGKPTTYVKKAVDTAFATGMSERGDCMAIVYNAGHWVSTHMVLWHLGIRTGVEMNSVGRWFIVENGRVTNERDVRLLFFASSDTKMRIASLPAGTARHARLNNQ